ncbi:hypothetical protein FOA43_000417 [Brettanomyces nanus]|uniref:DUF2428 domain-containing protein n=1 Tax=Eeniella nana TaxID=13502 RepID=A0A875RYX2_EENNA|nr:uncharacterized protein FOA43_000417 [Brettanomyces nanus]QPG73112.1 hypothetical protein FOA43_000417 [Brettanomyces nanus]
MSVIDPCWFDESCFEELSRQKLFDLKRYLIKRRNYIDEQTGQIVFLNKVPRRILNALSKNHVNIETTDYRTVACDAMAVWLSRASQLVYSQKSATRIRYAQELSSFVSTDTADSLLHYVIDFWTDSGSPLGNALKEMFIKLMSFITATEDDQFRKQLFQKWTLEALQIPYSMRVFYFLIEHLYKQVEPADFILQKRPTFVRDSLEYIWSSSLATNVGKAIVMVLRNMYSSENESEWMDCWCDDLIISLKNLQLRQGIETYLLPQLFKISKTATEAFLKRVNSENDITMLLGCLTVAQSTSIIIEPFDGENPLLSLHTVESLLIQDDEYFKVTAFSLLVSCPKHSSPIKPYLYDLISSCLDALFSEMNVETRNKMFSLLKKFILRIRDSTHKLQRDYKNMESKDPERFVEEIESKKHDIELGRQFLQNLLDFSVFNLKPGSSHQRKAFAFMVLLALIHSGLDSRVREEHHDKFKVVHYPFDVAVYSSYLLRVMIDNISDDYEDNRNSAVNVLSISPLSLTNTDLKLAKVRALQLLADLKGKNVDSGARFFCFLFQLYQNNNEKDSCRELLSSLNDHLAQGIAIAKSDIASACFKYSIQGYFAAFKLIIEIIDFDKTFRDDKFMIDMLNRLIYQAIDGWNVSKGVLQHDSPEGNLPKEIEKSYSPELEATYGKGTQIISSYAWRTLKESTGMLEIAIINAPLNKEQLLKIGPLLMKQLATIRHRGAFSAVYPTFVACCLRCHKTPEISLVTRDWLKSNLQLITEKSNFITRRSAGIPFLINGILTADPELAGPTFDKLMVIAQEPADADQTMENVSLPQVNAFNCIKAFFVDKALSEVSVLYIDRAMELALQSFESPIWAIRNCAVMLFTALENRMFSSRKLRNNFLPTYPAKLFFTKFGSIKETFLRNLQQAIESGLSDARQVQRIFPILTIMGRLDPTPNYTSLDAFRPLILQCLCSKQWKVREMAARSLPALLSSHKALRWELAERLSTVTSTTKDLNMAHGALLASKELLFRLREGLFGWSREASSIDLTAQSMISEVKKIVMSKLDDVLAIPCYPIQLEYFKLVSTFHDLTDYGTELDCMQNWLADHVNLGSRLNGGKQLAVSEACQIVLEHRLSQKTIFRIVVSECLLSELYEVQKSALTFCENHEDEMTAEEANDVVRCLWKLVQLPAWTYIKARSLKLLNELLVKKGVTSSQGSELDRIKLLMALLSSSESANKFLKLACIEALGPLVGKSLALEKTPGLDSFFVIWLEKVRLLVDDDLEYPERSAALRSLIGFNTNYFHDERSSEISKEEMKVVALLFRFLSDDDHELRDLVSQHLSTVVLGLDFTLVPAMTEKRMVDWLKGIIVANKALVELVFDSSCFVFFNYNQKFRDLFTKDLLLFKFEKQNLYRDEINRADQLNQILLEVEIAPDCEALTTYADAIARNVSDITNWIIKEHPVDGCLGWSLDEAKMEFVYENLQGLSTLIKIGRFPKNSELVEQTKKAFTNAELQIHPLLVNTVTSM